MILKAPDTCGSMSWGGKSYTISKKGMVKVPDEAVSELLQFGFTVAGPDDQDDPEAIAAFNAAQDQQISLQTALAEKAQLDQVQADGEAAAIAITDKVQKGEL